MLTYQSTYQSHTPARHTASIDVLRKTYLLLGFSLLFSAFTAYYSVISASEPGDIVFLGSILAVIAVCIFSELKMTKTAVSLYFIFTGLMGYSLGPILSVLLESPIGCSVILLSLFCTASIFLTLSLYVFITRENFSYLGGFLFAGIISIIIIGAGSLLFNLELIYMITSVFSTFIFAGYILYDTSAIIHGGEKNFVTAALSLYLNIYNLFINILRIIYYLCEYC